MKGEGEMEDKSLRACLEELEDPRMVNKCQHQLLDILLIGVCATIANAESWDDIALFAESKQEWLRQWLAMPNGAPSADTFRRVFSLLDSAAFERCFVTWMRQVFEQTDGDVVAVDGKVVRGTCDARGQGGLHLVSAWATANRVTLGQVKIDDKANEILAIPALLEVLALKGCIVTLDAMGCHKHILQGVRQQEADYIVTVKGNQPTLSKAVKAAFVAQDALGWSEAEGVPETAMARTQETGHGRHDIREAWVLPGASMHDRGWPDCQSFIRIQRTSTRRGKLSQETRYYISSLQADAHTLLTTVRRHWGIENGCHWVLDVVFHEDASRTRSADHNLATVRKIALNLLRRYPSTGSLKGRRHRAGWNEDYLTGVVQSSFNLMR